jgi:hypothetical protein
MLPGSFLVCVASVLVLLSACGGDEGPAGGATTDGGATPTTAEEGIRPVAGGFGGGLEGDARFLVTLIVFEDDSDTIDFVQLTCAPEGTLDLFNAISVGTDVPITAGAFSLESTDVAIDGEFVTPERAEGQIQALTPEAEACGVPVAGEWSAECELLVEASDGGFSAEAGGCGLIGE